MADEWNKDVFGKVNCPSYFTLTISEVRPTHNVRHRIKPILGSAREGSIGQAEQQQLAEEAPTMAPTVVEEAAPSIQDMQEEFLLYTEQPSAVEAENDVLMKLRAEIDAGRVLMKKNHDEINKIVHVGQANDVINEGNEATDIDNSGSANSTTVNSGCANSTNVNSTIDHSDGKGSDSDSVAKRQDTNVNNIWGASATSLTLAKEVTMEFDGTQCAKNWVIQLDNIAEIYKLDKITKRMLLIAKLKGNAQSWLHADSARILESAHYLCEQLIVAFGATLNKGEQRDRFQNRQWRSEENFATYFEEKMMLARNINIDTEELKEKIIDGIPASGLRDQARIQCFSDPKQILRAFSEIRLPQRKQYATPVSADAAANKGLRCANCNSRGHFAKDCFKPKRKPGSCYACGAFGHLVGQCPERKSVTNNNYVRYCKIFLCNKIVTSLIAACLIDSGSLFVLLSLF
ncbi:uncharacterized protein LOC117186386 isoform X2 [Drosophila miranda]|uniref:uncharacterized protein LOC117186386 isoform X2 n=1 Tax=Drosophila miranda TaxID=7229 RepID=UPI00143F3238|nr:uncharacterized protein LOC117186386 isoform X2 [Drosophila miranda]